MAKISQGQDHEMSSESLVSADGATSAGAFASSQILPSQYFDTSGAGRLSGEQRLMAALLADAINVFRKGVLSRSARQRLLYIDAERWIAGHGRIRHAFSFETVCDALGIDPGLVRRRMVEWKHSVRRENEQPARPLRLKFTPRHQRLSQRRSRATRPKPF
jgi:hypothetical protein